MEERNLEMTMTDAGLSSEMNSKSDMRKRVAQVLFDLQQESVAGSEARALRSAKPGHVSL